MTREKIEEYNKKRQPQKEDDWNGFPFLVGKPSWTFVKLKPHRISFTERFTCTNTSGKIRRTETPYHSQHTNNFCDIIFHQIGSVFFLSLIILCQKVHLVHVWSGQNLTDFYVRDTHLISHHVLIYRSFWIVLPFFWIEIEYLRRKIHWKWK